MVFKQLVQENFFYKKITSNYIYVNFKENHMKSLEKTAKSVQTCKVQRKPPYIYINREYCNIILINSQYIKLTHPRNIL